MGPPWAPGRQEGCREQSPEVAQTHPAWLPALHVNHSTRSRAVPIPRRALDICPSSVLATEGRTKVPADKCQNRGFSEARRDGKRLERTGLWVHLAVTGLSCIVRIRRRFGTKCAGCAQGISPSDLVRKARSKVFHLNCFTCMVCNKQLSTGEELYVIDENKFVCKDDYLSSSSLKEGSLNSGTPASPALASSPVPAASFPCPVNAGPRADLPGCSSRARRGDLRPGNREQLEPLRVPRTPSTHKPFPRGPRP